MWLPRLRNRHSSNPISNETLTEIVRKQFGLNDSSELQISRLANTGNSSIYLVEDSRLPTTLLLKQVYSNDAASQYRSLVAIDEVLGNSENRVPHPIACFEEHNIICMEYVDGTDLRDLLTNSKIAITDKKLAIEKSGHWLARFHAIRQSTPGPVDIQNKLLDLNTCISKSAARLARDPLLAAAYDWLLTQSRDLEQLDVATGIVHGDFKPENLIVSNEDMVGIDFRHDTTGTQLMDLAQFTNSLRILGMKPGGLRSRKDADAWIQDFVAGYRSKAGPISEVLLKWLRVHHLLRYWGIEKARRTLLGTLQATWLRKEIGLIIGPR